MMTELLILMIVMIVAIVLGLVEIFLLPGLTFAGIGGLLFASGGLYYAYSLSSTIGNWTLFSALAIFCVGVVWFMRSRSINRIALHTDVNSRLESCSEQGIQVGYEGIALSRLAPIGKAQIGTTIVEAKSETEFIDEKTPIVVVRVEGYNVIVKRK